MEKQRKEFKVGDRVKVLGSPATEFAPKRRII